MRITPYLRIIRPLNAVIAGITAVTGYWLSSGSLSAAHSLLLAGAALCALSYGNVINDIKDYKTDMTGHPGRPIPSGEITKQNAFIFSIILFLLALFSSFTLSIAHLIGTLIPIIILTFYSIKLKSTPLAGNIVISLLTGYTLLFGGIGTGKTVHLLLPALSAMLLNFDREIIKDVQDEKADKQCGLKTTAVFHKKVLVNLLLLTSLPYLFSLVIPWAVGHFGSFYIFTGVAVILPLQLWWQYIIYKGSLENSLKKVSLILKMEMLCGIAAMVIDRYLSSTSF